MNFLSFKSSEIRRHVAMILIMVDFASYSKKQDRVRIQKFVKNRGNITKEMKYSKCHSTVISIH